jgi:hypothetical protein
MPPPAFSGASMATRKHPLSVSPWPPLPPENGALRVMSARRRRETPHQIKPLAG